MKTAIVILNWNTKHFLEEFLQSVTDSVTGADVIVADNNSTDGSVEYLNRNFPHIRKIFFDKNEGFTGGYNLAFEKIKGDNYKYMLLLNSDIEVVPGWFEPLEEWMEEHPECGACAPKLHSYKEKDMFEYAGAAGGFIDKYGYPFCRGRIMKKVEKDYGQYDSVKNVFWATGACLMVRCDLWEKLGGLDSRFFAHMEEIDLCWRMQLAGYKITIIPNSVIYHVGGGTLPNTSAMKLFLNYRNNLLMLDNNLKRTCSLTMSPARACFKAEKIIITRMILDAFSALTYLMCGKTKYFTAVIKAHRDYRKLRKQNKTNEIAKDGQRERITIDGFYEKSILLQYILKGKKIFQTIQKL